VARLADLLPAPDVVCGPLTGGAYAAQLVADHLGTTFAWTSPPAYALTGDVTGRRVAIVDDAINAGSAVSATAAAITTAGGQLIAVAALLTLGAAPTRIADIPVRSLATLPSHLWPPTTCPHCAAGSPPSEPPA
jgi:orotate phosphoribosyltransferase